MSEKRELKLVVLHQGSLGDFVLALAVIQAARRCLGNTHVNVIADAPSAELAAGRSAVDTWTCPEHVGFHTLFSNDGPLDDRLAEMLKASDWVLSFLGDVRQPVHRRLCAPAGGRVVSIDPRPTAETLAMRRHITAQWCADIREEGLDIGDPEPPVIHIDGYSGAGPGKASSDRTRIVVHPGGGGGDKCWPIDRFINLVDSLCDLQVTWMLGPAECEAGDQRLNILSQRTFAAHESILIKPTLECAAQRISNADLYIGNDAGMTHLAAAIGTPTVAIFGPTDPRVWQPLGDHVIVVAPENTEFM